MNKQNATEWNFSVGDVVLTFRKGSFFPCQHYFSCDRRIHTMVSIPYAHIILTGKICILFTSSFAVFFLFRIESQKPHKMARKSLHLQDNEIAARIDLHAKNNRELCYFHTVNFSVQNTQKSKMRLLLLLLFLSCAHENLKSGGFSSLIQCFIRICVYEMKHFQEENERIAEIVESKKKLE